MSDSNNSNIDVSPMEEAPICKWKWDSFPLTSKSNSNTFINEFPGVQFTTDSNNSIWKDLLYKESGETLHNICVWYLTQKELDVVSWEFKSKNNQIYLFDVNDKDYNDTKFKLYIDFKYLQLDSDQIDKKNTLKDKFNLIHLQTIGRCSHYQTPSNLNLSDFLISMIDSDISWTFRSYIE